MEICEITDENLEISKHEMDENIKAHTINVKIEANNSYEEDSSESGDDLYKSVFSNEDDLNDII